MANVDMDSVLDIVIVIWNFMKTHGFNVSLGGQTYSLSFATIIIGLCVIAIVLTLIEVIWWGD